MSATESITYRPCLILAHCDAGYASEVARRFRREGWDVYQTHGGPEARRLARMLEPDLVVLGVDLGLETGFLTCAKLSRERPTGKIILVGEDVSPDNVQLALFAGATALVTRQDCLLTLVKASGTSPMPAAG